jgi:hypothetical protein
MAASNGPDHAEFGGVSAERVDQRGPPANQASRTFKTMPGACCATDFTGTKCMLGRPAASQIASASLRSFLPRLR